MNIAAWLRMLRMKERKSSYVRQVVSIPSVAIGAGWVLLWFLWPHGNGVAARRPVQAPVRVAFVRMTESVFSRTIPMHVWKDAGSDEEKTQLVPWMVTRAPKLLERSVFLIDEPSGAQHCDVAEMALSRLTAYRPAWNDKPVFELVPDGAMELSVEAAGRLASLGFKVPAAAAAAARKGDVPWLVTAVVAVDEKGKVESVFLENATENREINAAAVKLLYGCEVSTPGARCEGRVKVNFGQH